MLDAVSLDQPRTFIAATKDALRPPRASCCAQFAISDTIGNREEQIGVQLLDRSNRHPKLMPEGSVLLGDARSIITNVAPLNARMIGAGERLGVVREGALADLPVVQETLCHGAITFRSAFLQ